MARLARTDRAEMEHLGFDQVRAFRLKIQQHAEGRTVYLTVVCSELVTGVWSALWRLSYSGPRHFERSGATWSKDAPTATHAALTAGKEDACREGFSYVGWEPVPE